MKESRQVQIQADLTIKSSGGTEILVGNNLDEDLIVRVKSNSTPSFPISILKRGWRMRRSSNYLAQKTKLLFNDKPIISITEGKISYQNPLFLLKVLLKSIFR